MEHRNTLHIVLNCCMICSQSIDVHIPLVMVMGKEKVQRAVSVL